MRRRQRGREGAALVEAVIASALLLIMLAAIVFVHHLYVAKMDTIVQARAEAWAGGLDGCGGGLIAAMLDNVGLITALNEAENHDLVDAPEWVTDMGREVGHADPKTVSAGAPLSGGSYTLNHSTSVPCNEFAEDEDGSLVLNLFTAVRQIVPIDF